MSSSGRGLDATTAACYENATGCRGFISLVTFQIIQRSYSLHNKHITVFLTSFKTSQNVFPGIVLFRNKPLCLKDNTKSSAEPFTILQKISKK